MPNPSSPKVPRVVNLSDIKPGSRNITMIHLNKRQWGAYSKNLRPAKVTKLPGKGGFIELIPVPDGGVIMYPQCDSGPDNICLVVTKWTPGGVVMECRCRPRRKPGGGGGGVITPPPGPKCQVILAGGRFRCISLSNPPCASCRLRTVTFNGRIFITCTCNS